MRTCSCGWVGMNLQPNHQENSAHCPRCQRRFAGIGAADAQRVPPKEEKRLLDAVKTMGAELITFVCGAQGAVALGPDAKPTGE